MQGPAGPEGSQGDPGPEGEQGQQGIQGDPGQAGSQLVVGSPTVSAIAAPAHTLVTADATCPPGTVLLGGGAHITTTATQKSRAILVASYPYSTTTWTAIGVANGALGSGNTMTVVAYALCSL